MVRVKLGSTSTSPWLVSGKTTFIAGAGGRTTDVKGDDVPVTWLSLPSVMAPVLRALPWTVALLPSAIGPCDKTFPTPAETPRVTPPPALSTCEKVPPEYTTVDRSPRVMPPVA